MTDKLPVYGLLGLGDSEDDNIELQLDNFMPEDVGDLIAPKPAGPGVRKIARWLEDAFSTDVDRVPDVLASLAVRKAAGADVTLIVVLDDPVDEADAALVVQAIKDGIVVRSINHAMDEVSLEDVAPEVPVSEPEKPAAPRTRARRGSGTPQPAEASEAVSEPPAAKPRRGRPRKEASVTEAPAGEVAVTAEASPFWQGTGAELLALIDERVKLAMQHITLTIDTPPF